MGKRELEKRIRKLPKAELEILRAGGTSETLVANYLANPSGSYEAASWLARELDPIRFKPAKQDSSSDSLTNYETQLALTELLFACERHFLQEMKSGLRAADLKQLATVLKLEPSRLQLIFQLAITSQLIVPVGSRYVASIEGLSWLELDPAERWLGIAQNIWDLPELSIPTGSILAALSEAYPLLDLSELSILKFGHLLGLIDNYQPTPLMVAADQDLKNAAQLMADAFPEPAKRIIIQGDLSIITAGPISPATHRLLDLVSQSEDLGLACRFRISQNSVLHTMETGYSSKEIVELLESLGESKLPQPLTYLITQTEKKFGELRVSDTESGCLVESSDPILIAQIANDSSLAALMLRPSQSALTSRLGAELIYFNLRDFGYPAIMVDENQAVISPRSTAVAQVAREADPNLEIAKALIENEHREPDTNDHLRQLQFALKNKLKVGLRVEMPEGTVEIEMTPLGISGGRFRGRDVVKEAERTLPLSRIQAVWLS